MLSYNHNMTPDNASPGATAWTSAGSAPRAARQYDAGAVPMTAWVNQAVVQETSAAGRICYVSRGRSTLWRKGEPASRTQCLAELHRDGDARPHWRIRPTRPATPDSGAASTVRCGTGRWP